MLNHQDIVSEVMKVEPGNRPVRVKPENKAPTNQVAKAHFKIVPCNRCKTGRDGHAIETGATSLQPSTPSCGMIHKSQLS